MSHDPNVVISVLGGGQNTHRALLNSFELLAQMERHGGILTLFGRKINAAEHQPSDDAGCAVMLAMKQRPRGGARLS